MAVNVTVPEVYGKEIRTKSGIILPPTMSNSPLAYIEKGDGNIAKVQTYLSVQAMQRGFAQGYVLDREPETRLWLLPGKGTGWDDLAMGKIINGEIANVGSAPIISALASSLVQKKIAQATNAEVTLTGKASPVRKAKAGISRFNDSPIGVTAALQQAVYQLDVYNRGCPISTVPIIYPVETWSEYGMTLVPLAADGQPEADAMHYYIDMDWSRLRYVTPYLPSIFDLEPTGLMEWPYWYRVEIDKKQRWVLLHNSQIIQLIPGYSGTPGVGTSSAWLDTEQLTIYIMVKDAEVESLVNAPTSGFIAISGIEQDAVDVKEKVEQDRQANKARGQLVSKGFTIFTSDKPIDFKSFSFRDVQGYTQEAKEAMEDRIVANHRMTLSEAGLSRKGVGYAGQAETNRDMAADSGVGYSLKLFSTALGAMPTFQNVSIAINRQNDYARVRIVEDFERFAKGVQALPVGTLEPGEVRAMIESFLGIKIPQVDATVTTSPGAIDDQSDPGVNDASTSSASGDAATEQQQAAMMRDWLLEYYRLAKLASIEDTMNGRKGNALLRLWQTALRKQYRSAKVRNIVEELRSQGIEPSAADFLIQAVPIVEKNTDKLSTFVIVASMIAALSAIAVDGRLEAEDQARKVDAPRLSTRQRAEIDKAVRDDMAARLDELLVAATLPEDEDRETSPILDQRVKNILDVESFLTIAGLIRYAMRLHDAVIDIEAEYIANADLSADGRAEFVTDVEGGRAYTNGFSRAGREMGATGKRWNMTVSASPREVHLATVGEVVGIDEAFSNGDYWSQERINCKCSITLLWR